MRITAVETVPVSGGDRTWTMILVETDDGLRGLGEATLAEREWEVAAAVMALRPSLLGRDPFDVEALSALVGAAPRAVLSGVAAAMLDVAGKALKVPVYQMFGGAVRERARLSAIGWEAGAQAPEAWARRACEAVATGLGALTLHLFAGERNAPSATEVRRAVSVVETVRRAVGSDVDLIVNAAARFTPAGAATLARALAPHRPVWLEEPVRVDQSEALAKVARPAYLPLAAGSGISDRGAFRPLIESQSIDVAKLDLCRLGGIGEGRKLAALAEVYHIAVALDGSNSPLALAMALQLAACIPNLAWVDYPVRLTSAWSEALVTPFEVKDGQIRIPDGPGLGVEIRFEGAKGDSSRKG
jgi:galactonate dehydratase